MGECIHQTMCARAEYRPRPRATPQRDLLPPVMCCWEERHTDLGNPAPPPRPHAQSGPWQEPHLPVSELRGLELRLPWKRGGGAPSLWEAREDEDGSLGSLRAEESSP